MELNISNHARERFAERVMDKDQYRDVLAFVSTHSEDIDTRINKMVEFGEKIYSGRSLSEYNKAYTEVYLKNNWVIIVDPAKKKVVTLYAIDLGLGDEFNNDYIARLMAKYDLVKEDLAKTKEEIDSQADTYNALIKENEAMIAENNRINNELTKQNEGYKAAITGLNTQYDIAEQEIREIVGTLVGRKVY